MKVTLDTNCIIDLEENTPTAPFLRQLISLYDAHVISLRVVAISASERKPDGTYAIGFNEFKQKIAAVGLGHVEILPTLAYPGMAFPDWCYPTGGETTAFERKIQEVLFPTIEFDYREYRTRLGIDPTSDIIDAKWRNAKCDVLALWCHIRFHGDIFVTSDKNFHKVGKKGQLLAFGVGDILIPKDTVLAIRKNTGSLSRGSH
jgi:hypothetical protein